MPRLVGKRADASPAIALLFLIAIAAGVALEYAGYINVVPGFGRDNFYTSQEQLK